MRAEMTVGLDLESLENLRIFNGYEKEKNTRRLSLEAPSSPESDVSHQDSNTTQGRERKSKCGRPANPIPRHKRDSHIKAEYKRRDKIQKGFDTLISLVPELSEVSAKESKSTMLFKTAEHCRRLDSERGNAQKELTALRQELEALGTEIQVLQEQLPCHGVDTLKEEDGDLSMDTLYDQYVQEETKKNWKFWIFGYFMRPLYESFRPTVEGKNDRTEFDSTVSQWVQSKLSLGSLRKGFLDALRKISKYTSIMTNPEKLESESKTRIGEHCMKKLQDSAGSVSLPTSPGTPRVPTPAPVSSARCTPATTPVTSPPRTPNVTRRSSKHETVRATESRSRSNSPEEVRTKRRSSYRSRSGKRSPGASFREEKDIKVEYKSMNPGPKMPLLSHLLTSPRSSVIGPIEPVVMVTTCDNGITTIAPPRPSKINKHTAAADVSSSFNNHAVPKTSHRNQGDMIRNHGNVNRNQGELIHNRDVTCNKGTHIQGDMIGNQGDMIGNQGDVAGNLGDFIRNQGDGIRNQNIDSEKNKMLTTFIESLFSEKPEMNVTRPNTIVRAENQATNTPHSATLTFASEGHSYPINTHQPVNTTVSTMSNEMDICVSSTAQGVNSFVPLSTSGIISNNSVMQVEPSVTLADLLPMEVSMLTESNSDLLLNSLHMFNTSTSDQAPMNTYPQTSQSTTSTGMGSITRTDMLNTDEDSLTCMLGMDVLDVNSVFTFFDEGKSQL